jgi:uncharacterized membrane-anchored protein
MFMIIALAQLAAPAWMMWRYERVRLHGTEHRFRTAPIDPRDPFRGEHVILEFEAETGPFPLPEGWTDGPLHAELGADSAGFAVIVRLGTGAGEGDAVAVTVEDWSVNADDRTVGRVKLPFDRYYVREGQGPRTEALLQPTWTDEERVEPLPAHAVVRVRDGRAVVTDLVIGGRSLEAWMREPS